MTMELGPVQQDVLDIVTTYPGLSAREIYDKSGLCHDINQTAMILQRLSVGMCVTKIEAGYYPFGFESDQMTASPESAAIPNTSSNPEKKSMNTIVDKIVLYTVGAAEPVTVSDISQALQMAPLAAGNGINRAIKAGRLFYTGEKRGRERLYSGDKYRDDTAPVGRQPRKKTPGNGTKQPLARQVNNVGKTDLAPLQSANTNQVAGEHYKNRKIQPWDFIAANDLSWFQGEIIKYVVRYQEKNGIEDLHKARHVLDKLIEEETQDA